MWRLCERIYTKESRERVDTDIRGVLMGGQRIMGEVLSLDDPS